MTDAEDINLSDYSFGGLEPSHEADLAAVGYPDAGTEVYFGTKVDPGFFMETALILPRAGSSRICTGVLIARDVVLTARHCRTRLPISQGALVLFGDNTDFVLGENEASARFNTEVTDFELFPRERGQADIMLIRLKERAPDLIRLTPLANTEDLNAARIARIVGFGVTEHGTRGQKTYSDVKVVTPDCSGEGRHQGEAVARSKLYQCAPGGELVAGLVQEVAPLCSVAVSISDCFAALAGASEETKREWCSLTAIRNREFSVPPGKEAICTSDNWRDDPECPGDHPICSDTCNGDSGGPLFVAPAEFAPEWSTYNSPDVWSGKLHANGVTRDAPTYRVAAVTSRAVDTAYVRAHETPIEKKKCGNGGIYTILTGDRLAWINETLAGWGAAPRRAEEQR